MEKSLAYLLALVADLLAPLRWADYITRLLAWLLVDTHTGRFIPAPLLLICISVASLATITFNKNDELS